MTIKLLTLFLFLIHFSFRQRDTLYLQPDAFCGKDALVHSVSPNSNYATNTQLTAMGWTWSGTPGIQRLFIVFNYAKIPTGSSIISAELSLYGQPLPGGNGQHSTRSGSNAAWVKRVTSPWIENVVTWNNQPTTTNTSRVSIPASTSLSQNYLNINVTTLTQDIINSTTGN